MKKIVEDETVAEPAPEPAPNAYQMVNLLGNVIDQKPSEFATTFDQIMKDRIAQKVADRKAELTRDAFATAPAGDAEPEADEPPRTPIRQPAPHEQPEADEPEEPDEIEEPDESFPMDDDTEEEQPPPETAKTEDMSYSDKKKVSST
jgi:hypothetical protein